MKGRYFGTEFRLLKTLQLKSRHVNTSTFTFSVLDAVVIDTSKIVLIIRVNEYKG